MRQIIFCSVVIFILSLNNVHCRSVFIVDSDDDSSSGSSTADQLKNSVNSTTENPIETTEYFIDEKVSQVLGEFLSRQAEAEIEKHLEFLKNTILLELRQEQFAETEKILNKNLNVDRNDPQQYLCYPVFTNKLDEQLESAGDDVTHIINNYSQLKDYSQFSKQINEAKNIDDLFIDKLLAEKVKNVRDKYLSSMKKIINQLHDCLKSHMPANLFVTYVDLLNKTVKSSIEKTSNDINNIKHIKKREVTNEKLISQRKILDELYETLSDVQLEMTRIADDYQNQMEEIYSTSRSELKRKATKEHEDFENQIKVYRSCFEMEIRKLDNTWDSAHRDFLDQRQFITEDHMAVVSRADQLNATLREDEKDNFNSFENDHQFYRAVEQVVGDYFLNLGTMEDNLAEVSQGFITYAEKNILKNPDLCK